MNIIAIGALGGIVDYEASLVAAGIKIPSPAVEFQKPNGAGKFFPAHSNKVLILQLLPQNFGVSCLRM